MPARFDGQGERRSPKVPSRRPNASPALENDANLSAQLRSGNEPLTDDAGSERSDFKTTLSLANASLLHVLEEAPLYSAARSDAVALFDQLNKSNDTVAYAVLLKFMQPGQN